MTEQPLDLRSTLRSLRRRWWIVVGLVLIGISAGAGISLAKGPVYEARAGVLLPPASYDASGRSLRNVTTERRIASSAAVLGPAGQALNPPVAASRLVKRVRVGTVGFRHPRDCGASSTGPGCSRSGQRGGCGVCEFLGERLGRPGQHVRHPFEGHGGRPAGADREADRGHRLRHGAARHSFPGIARGAAAGGADGFAARRRKSTSPDSSPPSTPASPTLG